MFRFAPIAGIVLLAAGTCGKSAPADDPGATTGQTVSQENTNEPGEIEKINENLGNLKTDVQKQADDRARTIDEKIEKGTQ
jgi:hypothetical protein